MKKVVLSLLSVISLTSFSAWGIQIPRIAHQQNFLAQPADSNATWITESSGFTATSRGILQIVIPGSGSAWATAYDGSGKQANVQDYTRSADSGRTWTPGIVDSSSNTLNWSCITAIGANIAWAELFDGNKGGGFVYQTIDGGINWQKQNVFTSASFADDIFFWNVDTGMAFGDPVGGYFEIYTTADGGTTWTRVSKDSIPDPTSGEAGLTAVIATRGNIVWCGTSSGRIFKSVDFGHHWTVSAVPGAENLWDVNITFIDEANGYTEILDPNSGAITWYQTSDSGATWDTLMPTAGTMFVDDMVYVPNSPDILVSTGVNFNVASGSSYSLDGGQSWIQIDTGVQHTTVEFLNESTGYSGGFNIDSVTDGIYKFAGSFIATGIPIVTTDQFNLKLYPNPATDNLYVSFTTNNYDPINLNIYDVLGKQVYGTVYHDKTQLWLRSIDLSRLSNGVYSVEVLNNGNKEVRKIVVQH